MEESSQNFEKLSKKLKIVENGILSKASQLNLDTTNQNVFALQSTVSELQSTVSTKANQSSVTSIQTSLSEVQTSLSAKADESSVANRLSTKANQSSLNATDQDVSDLQDSLSLKADESSVAERLSTKANQSSLNATDQNVSILQNKLSSVFTDVQSLNIGDSLNIDLSNVSSLYECDVSADYSVNFQNVESFPNYQKLTILIVNNGTYKANNYKIETSSFTLPNSDGTNNQTYNKILQEIIVYKLNNAMKIFSKCDYYQI